MRSSDRHHCTHSVPFRTVECELCCTLLHVCFKRIFEALKRRRGTVHNRISYGSQVLFKSIYAPYNGIRKLRITRYVKSSKFKSQLSTFLVQKNLFYAQYFIYPKKPIFGLLILLFFVLECPPMSPSAFHCPSGSRLLSFLSYLRTPFQNFPWD